MGKQMIRWDQKNVKPPKPCHSWQRREGVNGMQTVCRTCEEVMPVEGTIGLCRKPSGVNLRSARLSGWTRKTVVGKAQ